MGLTLVFDFVVFFKKSNQILEMSSGWTEIELKDLKTTRIVDLKIKGGAPTQPQDINDKEVLRNRKGWRSVAQTLTATPAILSKLKIDIKSMDKLSVETKVCV